MLSQLTAISWRVTPVGTLPFLNEQAEQLASAVVPDGLIMHGAPAPAQTLLDVPPGHVDDPVHCVM